MKESYEIADLLNSSPTVNHVLTVIALAFNIFALIQRNFYPKLMLIIICTIALCIPVYDLMHAYIQAVHEKHNPSPFEAAFIYFAFAPGYLVLVAILLRFRSSKSMIIIAFMSIITGWIGVTLLYFGLS
jgi:hypothetical protein